MRARTVSASLLVAVAMIAAPAVAVADTGPGSHGGAGHSRSQAAKARAVAHRLEVQARSHRSFVLGGTVTAVQAPVVATDVVAAAPGTLTFVVHGGRWKVLRGATVTVTVAADAKVTRGGVVDLTAVLPGDHVVVKSHQVDVMPVAPPGCRRPGHLHRHGRRAPRRRRPARDDRRADLSDDPRERGPRPDQLTPSPPGQLAPRFPAPTS